MKEHTKTDILEAFNKLIRKTSMEKLTVESIIREAEVSKATFYRYFKDKYDVMNHNYKQLLDHMSSPNVSHSYLELYEALYTYGRKNWKYLQNAFNTIGSNSFCEYIGEYSAAFVEKITKMNRGGEGLTEAERLQLDVYTIGISIMYRNWIFDHYRLSPKEAAAALFEIMPKTLRDMWWLPDSACK